MSRTGITLEQVEVAAEHILSKGENPTIEKVRAIIGGTGSNTTISKYLQEWRSKRIMAEAPEFSSLKNPPDSVNAAVKHVWQQIREETDTEIEDIKKEATVLIAEAENKVYIAEKQSEKLLLLNHELQQQLYALQAKIEIQQLDFKKLQEENTLLHERNKGLDERYMQLQDMTAKHQQDRDNAHKNEIEHFIEKLEAQECTYQNLNDELKNYNKIERQRHMLEIDVLKTQNQNRDKDLTELQSTTKLKDLKLIELQARFNAVIEERNRLSEQVSKQEEKWELIEKNHQLTDKILAEVQEIPKFDSNLYINLVKDIQTNIQLSMEKLSVVTHEAKKTFELFNDKKRLNVTNE